MSDFPVTRAPNPLQSHHHVRGSSDVPSMIVQLDGVREKFPEWFAEFDKGQPLYCLPASAIRILSSGNKRGKRFIDVSHAAAEYAFQSVCDAVNAIGFWSSKPISYPCFRPPGSLIDSSEMQRLGWSRSQQRKVEAGIRRSENIWRRLKGYAGWLVLNPAYSQHRLEIERLYREISSTDRPDFPLHRAFAVPTPLAGTQQVGVRVSGFYQQLGDFLDHWGLVKLVTWDLPEPQGPLIPAPVGVNSPAMPRHGLHIVLPMHYPLTGEDLLLEEILRQQKDLAAKVGLDADAAGLPRFEVYGSLFDVYWLEKTVRNRYGPQAGGFLTRLEEAMAESLGLRLDYVQKLRRGISAIRRGKGASIKWLRVKSR